MNEKQLNKALRVRARELGLCDKWYRGWDMHSTKQELIEKYLEGIDFCIQHDYPKLEFIREFFPKNLLERNGVYLDEEISDTQRRPTQPIVVMLGKSKGELRYNSGCVANIYLRHQSEATIEAADGARVFVEVYENAKLIAKCDDFSKLFVYQHGGEVTADENVKVRDKRV